MPDETDPQVRFSTAAMAGFVAMQFASDPAIWPAFTAWAERRMPEQTWNENDRLCMAADSVILNRFAEMITP